MRDVSLPSEFQVCLWCATGLSTPRWTCADCRSLVKQALHEQQVLCYSLAGQQLLANHGPFPGSLTLREVKFAMSSAFQTYNRDLIHLSPLNNLTYPIAQPFPEDLPIRILGTHVQAFLAGSLRRQQESHMLPCQARQLDSATQIALRDIRNVPYTHLLHLICESMKHSML